MDGASFTLLPYTWRGKTYKSLRGLHTAVQKVHPGCALSFTADAMVISNYKTGSRYHYRRLISDSASVIEDAYIGQEGGAA